MIVNDELIEKLAHLSKLSFSDAEKNTIKYDLQNMITLIEKMNELDTENVEPLLHIAGAKNILREDVVESHLSTEEAMHNTNFKEAHFFKVPKVIRK